MILYFGKSIVLDDIKGVEILRNTKKRAVGIIGEENRVKKIYEILRKAYGCCC